MNLTSRDLQRLQGVNVKLIEVAELAAYRIPQEMPDCLMIITEGLRSVERQRQLVKAGASRTMNSNHITGRAFDYAILMGAEVRWDWGLYRKAADIIKACAADLNIKIVAGADWVKFRDGPHIELAKGEA